MTTAKKSGSPRGELLTNVLGYPRIGAQRELKKACEAFWNGQITAAELQARGAEIRQANWQLQKAAGADLIPSNDFSFYDHVLDMSLTVGAIPSRYQKLKGNKFELYFAMARGMQTSDKDFTAMEMTKWFDTNYHFIVPEFVKDQTFFLTDRKPVDEFREALALGIKTKPVILGPLSFLILGKEKEPGFKRTDLLARLLPVYKELLAELERAGADWVQIDEPCLVTDLDNSTREAYRKAYEALGAETNLKIIIATYFEGLGNNTQLAASLTSAALHVDLSGREATLDEILQALPNGKALSLGLVDGRNIWKNDLEKSLSLIRKAVSVLGRDRVLIAGSSSFLHVPCDLDFENGKASLPAEVRRWMAYARQKVEELALLKELAGDNPSRAAQKTCGEHQADIRDRENSPLVHSAAVAGRMAESGSGRCIRKSPFSVRRRLQQEKLRLPLFPTTTIGSFPQTKEVRSWRSKFKKGLISKAEYTHLVKKETEKCIRMQEKTGLDVLVHGEFERNDMVEYFGERLEGFAFSQNGWVQSYGSRCVKPPVIFGDVSRPRPMTVEWSKFAQSLTSFPVKGMLTGPVTILKWSFVRDDQPRAVTCRQIALAISDEVRDLEKAGIGIIQIDEPAMREALPLRRSLWAEYLQWAVDCFRAATCGVKDETQIHTHMCYSEFNDIIESIAQMDADAITIECSRSQMELLEVFRDFKYPNGIGPGVYDIHSARVPGKQEMLDLLYKAARLVRPDLLWVNPDCGLKTRGWDETTRALERMVEAAREIRKDFEV